MTIPAPVNHLVDWWSSYYGDHQAVSVTIRYLHLAALVVGGGAALTVDRSLWRAARERWSGGQTIDTLNRSHGIVLAGLAVIVATGLLMALADVSTYAVSTLFWTKIALVALLLANGAGLTAIGQRASASGASVPRSRRGVRGGERPPVAFNHVCEQLADGGGMSDRDCDSCSACPSRRTFLTQVSGSLIAGMLAPALVAASAAEQRYPIPAADGTTIDKKAQVIVVREQQKVYAFNLACPHENTALKWRDKDHRFQCPKHDSKYTPDGIFREGRATRNMDRLAVRRDGDQIVVGVNRLYRSDEQPKEWAEAVVQL